MLNCTHTRDIYISVRISRDMGIELFTGKTKLSKCHGRNGSQLSHVTR